MRLSDDSMAPRPARASSPTSRRTDAIRSGRRCPAARSRCGPRRAGRPTATPPKPLVESLNVIVFNRACTYFGCPAGYGHADYAGRALARRGRAAGAACGARSCAIIAALGAICGLCLSRARSERGRRHRRPRSRWFHPHPSRPTAARITFRDNGTGLSPVDAARRLVDVGRGTKDPGTDRGFRGIRGRNATTELPFIAKSAKPFACRTVIPYA